MLTKEDKEHAKSLLRLIEPELIRGLANSPKFGSIGYELFFQEGNPYRCEWTVLVSKLIEKEKSKELNHD
jgi:hypothetical protein